MARKLFTKEEVVLCTYIARFGRSQFNESDISNLEKRSVSSIKMKVSNIAAMLKEEGFEINEEVSSLSGKPPGQKGRRTNWGIVSRLNDYSKNEHLNECEKILSC
ncbi:MAG: hypothetical protein CMC70_10285 [Flavobacteriaceae bacterium]|nr:hypothetical protein [Flavobacteriaceae bacterium]|tara:strand:+ start:184 stop:498 length:315 start_codon:yes stop_codon:yes gene_type:complete